MTACDGDSCVPVLGTSAFGRLVLESFSPVLAQLLWSTSRVQAPVSPATCPKALGNRNITDQQQVAGLGTGRMAPGTGGGVWV